MGDVAVVTSFSQEGWERYGRRFYETFDQHWPQEIDLHLVSEDEFDFVSTGSARALVIWNLEDLPKARDFLDRFKCHGFAHGLSDPRPTDWDELVITNKWRRSSSYMFRFDAYKFCKKVFAIDLVAHMIGAKKLLWIDSDTITFAEVPMSLVDKVLPNDVVLSCLERRGYHSECGFIGYNLPYARHFIRKLANLYSENEVFALDEWHDSYVFDWLRREIGVPYYAIPHHSVSHPFINSVLGQYMDHLKGNRKRVGHSSMGEQAVHKNVAYWRR